MDELRNKFGWKVFLRIADKNMMEGVVTGQSPPEGGWREKEEGGGMTGSPGVNAWAREKIWLIIFLWNMVVNAWAREKVRLDTVFVITVSEIFMVVIKGFLIAGEYAGAREKVWSPHWWVFNIVW
jgi:hypothetical protein